MGFLSIFSRAKPAATVEEIPPPPVPTGTFTIDHTGRISTSTVPSYFPPEAIQEVGKVVLELIRTGKATGAPVTEVALQFDNLKVNAREMKGGAIVFFSPTRLGGR